MKKFFLFATALLMSASMFAKTSVITYTASEKLPETTDAGKTDGLHLNAFYAADSTQLTVTHTFDEAEGVGTITLDGEVTIIGDRAFYKTGITSVTLPASVTTIGSRAFVHCTSLSSITLPEGLKTIGYGAFEEGFALSTITIPSSVTTIGECAFDLTGLESITFAEGSQLTTIEASAFYYNSLLKSIDIPASVTEIGDGAFSNCSALQSVTLPATLKSIGMSTFRKCTALTSITLPTSLDSIGEQAFSQSGLESITIPASVDTIGGFAFGACTSLTSIVVEAGNTKYDSRDNCNGIVEKATNTLIAACPATIIPNTVAILDKEVFEMLPITAITIPASVNTIKSCAFMACSSLAEVTVQWTTSDAIPSGDNMGFNVFSGIAAGAKLRVPTGTRALYEAAEQWKDFTIIEEYTPTTLPQTRAAVKATKRMVNGQLVIESKSLRYNAAGQEIH